MQRARDIALFAGMALAYSLAVGALVQPAFGANSLVAVAVASVMLSARGIRWGRRLAYAAFVLGTFLAFEWLTRSLQSAYGSSELVFDVLGMIAIVFTMAFPLAVLLGVVGRDPSVLWIPVGHHDGNRTPKRRVQKR